MNTGLAQPGNRAYGLLSISTNYSDITDRKNRNRARIETLVQRSLARVSLLTHDREKSRTRATDWRCGRREREREPRMPRRTCSKIRITLITGHPGAHGIGR